MSTGWSLWIVLLTIANILACVWLLRWTAKPKAADEKIGGGADTTAWIQWRIYAARTWITR